MSEWDGSIIGYIIIGLPIFLISQFLIRPLLGFYTFKLFQLILWASAEMLLIALGIYLFLGPNFPNLDQKLEEYFLTLKYVCLIIASPYILSIWFIASRQMLSTYENLTASSGASTNPSHSKLLSIKGESNKVIFAINIDLVVFIKSAGNYLEINYLHGGHIAKELVRMSLKELEGTIQDSHLLKIHRSFIVNKEYISSFKKTRKGYELRMQHFASEALPVSLGFKDSFEEALTLNMSH
jgi:hypothetical protein